MLVLQVLCPAYILWRVRSWLDGTFLIDTSQLNILTRSVCALATLDTVHFETTALGVC